MSLASIILSEAAALAFDVVKNVGKLASMDL